MRMQPEISDLDIHPESNLCWVRDHCVRHIEMELPVICLRCGIRRRVDSVQFLPTNIVVDLSTSYCVLVQEECFVRSAHSYLASV